MIKIEDTPVLTEEQYTEEEKEFLGKKFGLFNYSSVIHTTNKNLDSTYWFNQASISTGFFSKYKELYVLNHLTYAPEFNETSYSPLMGRVVAKILANNPEYRNAFLPDQSFLLYLYVPMLSKKLINIINTIGPEIKYMKEENLAPYVAENIVEKQIFQKHIKNYQIVERLINTQ